MSELSSLDIKLLVHELQSLAGARMEKFYQLGRELHILLHVPQKGTHTLVLGAGKLFLTKKHFEYPPVPPAFAMTLRKYAGGRKITAITQHGFDRVVIVETETHKIIAELFRNGNIVLTDADYRIWSMLERQEWRDRAIKLREAYKFPAKESMDECLKRIREPDKQIVVFLASDLSFGGEYAEEILVRAGVEKSKACKSLSEKEASAVSQEIKKILSEKPAPYILRDSAGKALDFAPFSLARHAGGKKEEKETFNEAVAEYFLGAVPAESKAEKKAEKSRAGKFDIRLAQQVSALETLQREASRAKKIGDMIYANYGFFEEAVREKEKHKMNQKEKTIIVELEGEKIKIFYEYPLQKSAETYYLAAKRCKEKLARIRLQIDKTHREMELSSSEANSKKTAQAKSPKKREWYHVFRWFFTSGGFLCVCGKDADTNEELVKKRMENSDLVLHADITGSPFALLKTRGKPADEKSIKEALEFVASYSRAWQAGVGQLEAYWVLPEQVTKKAPSGEHISKGSFMIYGKKNIHKTELRLAIGLAAGEIMCAAVSSVPEPFVVIKPGRIEAKVLAETIKQELLSKSPKGLMEKIKKLRPEEIARLIPFGKGSLS